ncbi:hypothetical protein ABKN59_005617 [Abortiporus biennis]
MDQLYEDEGESLGSESFVFDSTRSSMSHSTITGIGSCSGRVFMAGGMLLLRGLGALNIPLYLNKLDKESTTKVKIRPSLKTWIGLFELQRPGYLTGFRRKARTIIWRYIERGHRPRLGLLLIAVMKYCSVKDEDELALALTDFTSSGDDIGNLGPPSIQTWIALFSVKSVIYYDIDNREVAKKAMARHVDRGNPIPISFLAPSPLPRNWMQLEEILTHPRFTGFNDDCVYLNTMERKFLLCFNSWPGNYEQAISFSSEGCMAWDYPDTDTSMQPLFLKFVDETLDSKTGMPSIQSWATLMELQSLSWLAESTRKLARKIYSKVLAQGYSIPLKDIILGSPWTSTCCLQCDSDFAAGIVDATVSLLADATDQLIFQASSSTQMWLDLLEIQRPMHDSKHRRLARQVISGYLERGSKPPLPYLIPKLLPQWASDDTVSVPSILADCFLCGGFEGQPEGLSPDIWEYLLDLQRPVYPLSCQRVATQVISIFERNRTRPATSHSIIYIQPAYKIQLLIRNTDLTRSYRLIFIFTFLY